MNRKFSTGVHLLKKQLEKQLEEIQAAGTYKRERVITSPQCSEIKVRSTNNVQEKKVLNFCANNYLGLSNHPEIVAESERMLRTHGAGLSSVRFICGTQDIHKDLENKISHFHSKEDTILYPSCFDANGGIFEALLTEKDAVISDSLNHASIIDGIRLCKARKFRYNHCDMEDLENKLKEANDAIIKIIATDGVFSMDGKVTPLDRICDLADKYNAIVFIDECHATGFFGKTGRGTPEHFNVEKRVDIINSTLGKALGGASGGYTTGPKEIVDLLRQRSRPYLFSNTLAPPIVGAASKAFDIILNDTSLRDKLMKNTQIFRQRMKDVGFNIKGDHHPICPVMIGDARLASLMSEEMLQRGIYVIGFSYPVVPKGEARIRVQLSAAHTNEQIDRTINAFIEVGRLHKIIS
jgi:glycine C-acetyltransferase